MYAEVPKATVSTSTPLEVSPKLKAGVQSEKSSEKTDTTVSYTTVVGAGGAGGAGGSKAGDGGRDPVAGGSKVGGSKVGGSATGPGVGPGVITSFSTKSLRSSTITTAPFPNPS